MLELGRARSIGCDSSPIIGPEFILVDTKIDHGLDRKHMSWLHGALGLISGIMGHVGRGMEERADAMPAISGHDGASSGFGDHTNRLAEITIEKCQKDSQTNYIWHKMLKVAYR